MKEWRLDPARWDALSQNDREYMIAATNSIRRMEAWEHQEAERKSGRGKVTRFGPGS